jgi:hypothetical protein
MANADRCHLHIGLARTQAEIEAARAKPLKHGYYAKTLLEGEAPLFEDSLDEVKKKRQVLLESAAFLRVRAIRVAAWEANQVKDGTSPPSAHTLAAFAALREALRALPDEEEAHECLTDEEVRKHVDVLLADPELFLKRHPPEVAAKIRQVLREASQPACQ